MAYFTFCMTGRLKYFKDIQKDSPYGRLLIGFASGFHLASVCQRMLGEADLAEDVETFIEGKKLGLDALDLDFTGFKEILRARRETIKSTLMNQHRIAGIGTVHCDEILFQAGLCPDSSANRLDEKMLEKLFRGMKMVLQTAIDHRANPDRFPRLYLLVPRHKEGKCFRCNTKREKIKIALTRI